MATFEQAQHDFEDADYGMGDSYEYPNLRGGDHESMKGPISTKTMKYNHLISISFEVESNSEDGKDITPEQFEHALLQRIGNLKASEWKEACLFEDTYEVEE